MSDFEIRGAEDFLKLSKALKGVRPELRKELHKAMREAGKPLVKVAKDAAADVFPRRGGLAARESKVRFTSQVRTGSATAGLRIIAPGRFVVAKTTNKTGRFRHPAFARKGTTRRQWTWVNQVVPGGAGWFDRRMQAAAPTVRPGIESAMERVAQKVISSG
jgi:hypothetical protein